MRQLDRLIALDQTMDRAQVALRVALAAHRFVHLGSVGMGLGVGGIAFERAQKTSQRILMLVLIAVEQAELQVDVGAGGNDRGRAEQMAHRTGEIALAFEQRGEAHMRLEVAGLTAYELAVDVKRAERILVCHSTRFLETLARASGPETVFDLAGLTAALEGEDQLARLSFDERGTVAHYYAAFVVDEFQGSDGALRIDQRPHPLESSLNRIDMLAGAEQFLRQAHLEQVVERETVIAAPQIQRTHEITLDPVANTLGRDRENP